MYPLLEVGVPRDFLAILSMNQTHLGPIFKNCFRGDIREISDSVHANTARSQTYKKNIVMFRNKRSQAKVFTVYLSLVARHNYL